MKKIIPGVVRFGRDVYPQRKPLFEKLADGQHPRALFITCADSRIDPSLITQTEPGELFICRNAGNIVPPHTGATGGMTASIEYAVAALEVPHIIVCGHTSCGAMGGAMHPETLTRLRHVREWLTYSEAALQVVDENQPGLDAKARLNALIDQNVLLQIQHLRTHPYVAAREASGKLSLHGWVYEIGTGRVNAYNSTTRRFEQLIDEDGAEPGLSVT